MTVEEAMQKYASERGVSREVDEANLKLIEEAKLSLVEPQEATVNHPEVQPELPHESGAPVTSEYHSETQPHE